MTDDGNGSPESSFGGRSEMVIVESGKIERRRVLRRLLNVRITEKNPFFFYF